MAADNIGNKTADQAEVGDFYMSDGTLVGKGFTLTKRQKESCIGIVFSANATKAGIEAQRELGREAKGLVMALTDAAAAAPWGVFGIDENRPEEQQNTVQQMYEDYEGFCHTINILDKGEDEVENDYPAFYKTMRYGHNRQTRAYAPSLRLTTGWFMPSVGQWIEFLENLGGLKVSDSEMQTDEAAISRSGKEILNKINDIFGNFSAEAVFANPGYYWTSSEFDSNNACTVFFHGDGYFDFNSTVKNSAVPRTRCILAF